MYLRWYKAMLRPKVATYLISIFISLLTPEMRDLSVNYAPYLLSLSSSVYKMSLASFYFIVSPIFLDSSCSTAHLTYLFKYTCILCSASKWTCYPPKTLFTSSLTGQNSISGCQGSHLSDTSGLYPSLHPYCHFSVVQTFAIYFLLYCNWSP